MISRTDATKYLMKYISDNNLQNPTNKRFIIPDAKLDSLLGETSRNTDITHFNIQRYINLHFVKKTADIQEAVLV
jgi:chromatin remodeling complex protein RSC6